MIDYVISAEGLEADELEGFFVGWPRRPSAEQHLELLRGSSHVVLARTGGRVVGFVTAISDGVISAYIPLLEVLPEFQGRGIGTELMRRLLREVGHLYMVDLSCDEASVPSYERLGLQRLDAAMGRRNRAALGPNVTCLGSDPRTGPDGANACKLASCRCGPGHVPETGPDGTPLGVWALGHVSCLAPAMRLLDLSRL